MAGLVLILMMHFFLEYGVQPCLGWAQQKHRSLLIMGLHLFSYWLGILLVAVPFLVWQQGFLNGTANGLMYATFNVALHGIVDIRTAPFIDRFYRQGRTRALLTTHGISQALYIIPLVVLWGLI